VQKFSLKQSQNMPILYLKMTTAI